METIKSNEEISRLFSCGKRFSNKYATFIAVPKGTVLSQIKQSCKHDLNGRVAFIAGKKHGNAVWRNSAKRRLREIYRHNSDSLSRLDMLFIAKPQLMKESYSKVLYACDDTLKRFHDGCF